MSNLKHVQGFDKGMNYDLDDLSLPPGATRAVYNLRYSGFHTANEGALSSVLGVELIDATGLNALPPGANEVIGWVHYGKRNSIVYFVWNGNGSHSIRMLSPDAEQKISVILQEGYRGGYPRPDLWLYTLGFSREKRITHANVIGDILTWVVAGEAPYKINIERALAFNYFQAGGYVFMGKDELLAAKAPPLLPPAVMYTTDPSYRHVNMLRGNNYNFKYSYVYRDSELSTTSPSSRTLFAEGDFNRAGVSYPELKRNNSISVTVETGRREVEFIRLYVRVNNQGDWVLFKELNKQTLGIIDNSFYTVSFRGIEHKVGVDQDYVNRLFSNVPIRANAQEFIDAKYLVYGGVVIGRDYLSEKYVDIRTNIIRLPDIDSVVPWNYELPVQEVSIGGDTYTNYTYTITVYPHVYVAGRKLRVSIKMYPPGGSEVNVCEFDHPLTAGAVLENRVHKDLAIAIAENSNGLIVTTTSEDGTKTIIWASFYDIGLDDYFSPRLKVEVSEVGEDFDYQEVSQGGIKLGATTGVGVVYKDEFGRRSGVNELGSVDVPWYSDIKKSDPGVVDDTTRYRFELQVQLFHQPPIWAKTFDIVVTRPWQVSVYIQTYAVIFATDNAPFYTLSLSKYNEICRLDEARNIRPYTFTAGDRVRVVASEWSGMVPGAPKRIENYVEAEILGYAETIEGVSPDVLRITPFDKSLLGGSPYAFPESYNCIVEVYTPSTLADSKLYYEVGCAFPVINPGAENRAHGGNVVDEVNPDRHFVRLSTVNCFHHSRFYRLPENLIGEAITILVESKTYSDYAKSLDAIGYGSVNIFDESIKETFRNALMYSEAYFDNTNINGLSMFHPDSRYRQISEKGGAITGLRYVGNVLTVIQERDNLSIYVGRAGLSQASEDGVDLVVSTDQVLNTAYPSSGEYGCMNPESIAVVGRSVYFYDINHSAIVRRAPNGLIAITDKYGLRVEMVRLSELLRQNWDLKRVITGYNEKFNELAFTFFMVKSEVTGGGYWTEKYTIKYGALYNLYAATDERNITSSDDWRIATAGVAFNFNDDIATLDSYVSTIPVSCSVNNTGLHLKIDDPLYWHEGTEGLNTVNFNAKGAGIRDGITGIFSELNEQLYFWCNTTIFVLPDKYGSMLIAGSTDEITYGRYLCGGNLRDAKNGQSIRFLRDATIEEQSLDDGTACAPYIGNDGRNYRTVKIGTQVWMADNLAETKFRFNYVTVENGVFYNVPTILDERNIAAVSWRIPIGSDVSNLMSSVGATYSAGRWRGGVEKLRVVGFESYEWDEELQDYTYIDGTNESGFAGKPLLVVIAGSTNQFMSTQKSSFFYIDAGVPKMFSFLEYEHSVYIDNSIPSEYYNTHFRHLRLCRDAGDMIPGETGSYTGNDGKIYPTICIGNLEWMSVELCETKWRNGSYINEISSWDMFGEYITYEDPPYFEYIDGVEDSAFLYCDFTESESVINTDWIHGFDGGVYMPISDADWAALTSDGMCFYDDEYDNGFFVEEVRVDEPGFAIQVISKTFVFDEENNSFRFVYDLKNADGIAPDCHAWLGDRMFSFLFGKSWQHNVPGLQTFFGVFHPRSVEFVVNPEPLKTKVFDSIALLSNSRWTARFEIIPSENVPAGMASSLSPEEYKSEEGVFYSEIHGNAIDLFTGVESVWNMINGEPLRGNSMRVKLTCYDEKGLYLAAVIFNCSRSEVSG